MILERCDGSEQEEIECGNKSAPIEMSKSLLVFRFYCIVSSTRGYQLTNGRNKLRNFLRDKFNKKRKKKKGKFETQPMIAIKQLTLLFQKEHSRPLK